MGSTARWKLVTQAAVERRAAREAVRAAAAADDAAL
jgi:hypothetical protein